MEGLFVSTERSLSQSSIQYFEVHVADLPVGSEDGRLLVDARFIVVGMEVQIGVLQVRAELVDLIVQVSLVRVEECLLSENHSSPFDLARCEGTKTSEGRVSDTEVVVSVLLWNVLGWQ